MYISIELTESLMSLLLCQAAVEEVSAEEIIIRALKKYTERSETDV